MDIRSRLSRIRVLRPGGEGPGSPDKPIPGAGKARLAPAFKKGGWVPLDSAGGMTLRRTEALTLPIPIPGLPPPSLGILAPGGEGLHSESLLFFDLETTGLSTGAGTTAFLAAFGVLERAPPAGGRDLDSNKGAFSKIRITQYLLLDYPGEGEFLEALLGEFRSPAGAPGARPTVVSYNGKTFDVQILRNRCLMRGLVPPVFDHLDLLHPARRLWKGILPNCSQATVETEILSLSREGDLSGAFAPEAWFDFLNAGKAGGLLRICDHNSRDILGLASIFGCLCRIAGDPLGQGARYSANAEQLALSWQRALVAGDYGEEESRRARALLERGAALGCPRCCRKLAIEAEWRGGDIAGALGLVERALGREMPGWLRGDLEGRRERLRAKAGRR
jgi:uncharacterized protein YprB with RNaseH-like and TPR domain